MSSSEQPYFNHCLGWALPPHMLPKIKLTLHPHDNCSHSWALHVILWHYPANITENLRYKHHRISKACNRLIDLLCFSLSIQNTWNKFQIQSVSLLVFANYQLHMGTLIWCIFNWSFVNVAFTRVLLVQERYILWPTMIDKTQDIGSINRKW